MSHDCWLFGQFTLSAENLHLILAAAATFFGGLTLFFVQRFITRRDRWQDQVDKKLEEHDGRITAVESRSSTKGSKGHRP